MKEIEVLTAPAGNEYRDIPEIDEAELERQYWLMQQAEEEALTAEIFGNL